MQGKHNCIFDIKERLENENKEKFLDFKQNIDYILRNHYLTITDFKSELKLRDD